MKNNFPHSIYLKGQKIDKNALISKYTNELRYSAIFLSNSPDNEIILEEKPINVDDYQYVEQDRTNHFCIVAKNKKTNKKVLIEDFNRHSKLSSFRQIYYHHLLRIKESVKIIGFCFKLTDEEKEKLQFNRYL